MSPTAEQVLQLLNGGEPLDLSTLRFLVITESEAPDLPVGMILIMDKTTGRTLFDGVKPSKCGAAGVDTDDWDEAQAVSAQAQSEARTLQGPDEGSTPREP
ncbi:hypothetical protein [Sphaerisporangium aureirubrum]|uniref:Uncharacterized protein n=1 Tax=Sphaerisporangium aureirubrum TaxID=1544736 RepID=A0ABW1NCD1_9ACTN